MARHPLRSSDVGRLLTATVAAIALAFAGAPALAQPAGDEAHEAGTKAGAKGKKPKGGDKDKVQRFDFTGIDLEGRIRTPQLLYFLDRASEELERASLERRSFIPEMVRSVEEENL